MSALRCPAWLLVNVWRYGWFVLPPSVVLLPVGWLLEGPVDAALGPLCAALCGVVIGAGLTAGWTRLIWYAPWLREDADA
jgi:hypothetical protein